MDYFLKFKTEAAASKVLFTLVDGEATSKFPSHAIDIIGVIYKATGTMLTSEDGSFPEMAPIPGWHVNVRGDEAPELEAYAVTVATPARVWA